MYKLYERLLKRIQISFRLCALIAAIGCSTVLRVFYILYLDVFLFFMK